MHAFSQHAALVGTLERRCGRPRPKREKLAGEDRAADRTVTA
jgi:hypothetical protein